MEEFIERGQILFPDQQRVETWQSKEDLLTAIRAGDVPMTGRAPMLREDLPDLDFWVGKPVGFGTPRFKRYKKDLRNATQPLSSWITPRSEEATVDEGANAIVSGTNDEGAKVIKDVFGEKAFNYAKPVSLIRELVRQSTSSGDLVLDFFAGSATTAQAVMEVNASDAGSRGFIMVSSTEATAAEPDKNLCRDVTAERIRRLNAAGTGKYADLSAEFAYLRMNPGDEALIDFERATLTAGWTQHRQICARLEDKDIGVVPLMLVQVEDQATGGEDPVARVKAKLLEIQGVREDLIAVHTSGQPDADFHTMAYDHSKQILIFKVAVATGFDAPRAWTLVSVRPNRGTGFGLQIVGRIMRVHPLVRPLHGQDALLDKGYVFLTDPDMQAGLSSAVDELKAVRQSLTVLSDQLDVVEYGAAPPAQPLLLSDAHRLTAYVPPPPADDAERQSRLDMLIDEGVIDAHVRGMTPDVVDRAIVAGETARLASQTPLFGNLPEHAGPSAPPKPIKQTAYRLNRDLGLPAALWQEHPLDYRQLNDPVFLSDVANAFCDQSALVGKLGQTLSRASMSLHDLFIDGEEREVSLSLKISNARVAERAQAAFQLNDSIDPRHLERALIAALRSRAEDGGYSFTDQDLRRTIQLAVMREPDALMAAIKIEQGKRARLDNTIPIPETIFDYADLMVAQKASHGVFPSKMNKPERAFAEMLDADTSGTVQWWLRNPENELWATRMMLPTGARFFPDFAVGIKGRTSRDGIALVEIKDDGEDGRLHSDKNRLKIQVQHREYRNVFWSCDSDRGLVQLGFNEALNLIQPLRPFEISRMVFLHN
jgi:hypothetical protein